MSSEVASAQALAIPTGVVCPEFSAKWKIFLSISQGPQWITSVGQLSAFVGNTSLGSISRGWGRLLETVVTSTGFVRPEFSAKWKLFLSISKEPQRITSVYQLSAFVGNVFLGSIIRGWVGSWRPLRLRPGVRPEFSAKWKILLLISKEPQRITNVYQLSAFVSNSFVGRVIWWRSFRLRREVHLSHARRILSGKVARRDEGAKKSLRLGRGEGTRWGCESCRAITLRRVRRRGPCRPSWPRSCPTRRFRPFPACRAPRRRGE